MANHDAEYFLEKFGGWLSAQDASPTGFDIIRTGDFEILAGYAIHVVGAARLSYPIGRSEGHRPIGFDRTIVANPAMRVFTGLASAWELAPEEKLALLGVGSAAELLMLEQGTREDVPSAIVERLVILLSIFKSLNTLFPIPARADGWIRRPSTGGLFAGRTPLQVMSDSPDGIRHVEKCLIAEIWS